MKRLLLAVAVLLLAVTPARAEDAEQVAAALRSAPVYQAPGLDLVDVATLTSELSGGDPQVYVAVLPASAATSSKQARQRAVDIGKALGDFDAVVLVVTANRHLGTGEGSTASGRGVDSGAALAAELKLFSRKSFDKDSLTAFVLSFSERIQGQVSRPQAGGGSVDTGGGSGTGVLVGGALVVGGGLAAAAAVALRRRRTRLNEDLRADVEQPSLIGSILDGGGGFDPGYDDVDRAGREAAADADSGDR